MAIGQGSRSRTPQKHALVFLISSVGGKEGQQQNNRFLGNYRIKNSRNGGKNAITIAADLRTAAVGKGEASQQKHINKQELGELHAHAIAPHNPHTPLFPKTP